MKFILTLIFGLLVGLFAFALEQEGDVDLKDPALSLQDDSDTEAVGSSVVDNRLNTTRCDHCSDKELYSGSYDVDALLSQGESNDQDSDSSGAETQGD